MNVKNEYKMDEESTKIIEQSVLGITGLAIGEGAIPLIGPFLTFIPDFAEIGTVWTTMTIRLIKKHGYSRKNLKKTVSKFIKSLTIDIIFIVVTSKLFSVFLDVISPYILPLRITAVSAFYGYLTWKLGKLLDKYISIKGFPAFGPELTMMIVNSFTLNLFNTEDMKGFADIARKLFSKDGET